MILIAYASSTGRRGRSRSGSPSVCRSPGSRLRSAGRAGRRSRQARGRDRGQCAVPRGMAPDATTFVRKNATALSRIPTWLFSVGPLAADVKDDEEQPIELAEFRDKIGESHHVVFHGALHHSKLDRSDRMTMKTAGAPEGDFRNWDAIAAWVDGIATSFGRPPEARWSRLKIHERCHGSSGLTGSLSQKPVRAQLPRMLIARDMTATIVASEIVLSSIISILARDVSGMTSVVLNAVAVEYPRNR